MEFKVPTGDTFDFIINSVSEVTIDNAELTCVGVNIDMENNSITDANQIQITGSSGDTVFGLITGASNVFDLTNPNTAGNIRLICDDASGNAVTVMTLDAGSAAGSNTITFEKDTSFAILDEIGTLQFAVASGNQPAIIGNSAGMNFRVQALTQLGLTDGAATFYTTTSDTGTYDIKFIQNNDTPADDRAIVNIDFSAENSASVDVNYARISATSKDVTDGTEDGLLEMGVASDGVVRPGLSIQGDTSSLVAIGFYDATPVSKPSHIADATDAATAISQLNLLLADMAALGLQASS